MKQVDSAGASYRCPHCHTLLTLRQGRWQGWVRCPECDKPGLPPERAVLRKALDWNLEEPTPIDLHPVESIGKGSDTAAQPFLAPAPPQYRPAPSSASRLIVSTGLIVSVCLLLVAFLDRSSQSSAIFGFLTVIFSLLLLRLPRKR